MDYQLIIRKRPATEGVLRLDELFAAAKRLDFSSPTYYIASEVPSGEPGYALPLPAGAAIWLEQGDSPEKMFLKAVGGVEVTIHGQSLPGDGVLLHSGDTFLFGDWCVRFHIQRQRAGISHRAVFLGRCTLLGILLVLLAELFAAGLLPFLMRKSDLFLQEMRQQLVAHNLDALRKALDKAEAHTPVAKAFLDALDEELDERVRLLRGRSVPLTAQECADLLENLAQTTRVVQRLAQKGESPEATPAPKLDAPVEAIIQESSAP